MFLQLSFYLSLNTKHNQSLYDDNNQPAVGGQEESDVLTQTMKKTEKVALEGV